MKTAPKSVTQWRRQLDQLVRRKTPLALKDFPQLDDDIHEAFAEGVTVAEYFDDTIRRELESLGFPYEDLDDAEVQEKVLAELEAQGYPGCASQGDARGGRS